MPQASALGELQRLLLLENDGMDTEKRAVATFVSIGHRSSKFMTLVLLVCNDVMALPWEMFVIRLLSKGFLQFK